MIGVELVKGNGSVNHLPPEDFLDVWEACKDMGLIVGKGGHYGNVSIKCHWSCKNIVGFLLFFSVPSPIIAVYKFECVYRYYVSNHQCA